MDPDVFVAHHILSLAKVVSDRDCILARALEEGASTEVLEAVVSVSQTLFGIVQLWSDDVRSKELLRLDAWPAHLALSRLAIDLLKTLYF